MKRVAMIAITMIGAMAFQSCKADERGANPPPERIDEFLTVSLRSNCKACDLQRQTWKDPDIQAELKDRGVKQSTTYDPALASRLRVNAFPTTLCLRKDADGTVRIIRRIRGWQPKQTLLRIIRRIPRPRKT